jgi:DDE superfamily endonuclease
LWRERWDEEAMAARRAACHLPQDVHHRPTWQLVLDMLDELAGRDLSPPVLLADSAYGEVGCFRGRLDAAGERSSRRGLTHCNCSGPCRRAATGLTVGWLLV